jgi:predicted O-methyltransferase YrrM
MAKPKPGRRIADLLAPAVDLSLLPLAFVAAGVLRGVRRLGLQRLPICRRMLVKIGLLPIRKHYYEPFTTEADLRMPLSQERLLPGIKWNDVDQLAYLSTLKYADELSDINAPRTDVLEFRLDNDSFGSGDAEFLYQLIRDKKPKRIFEIGSGHSTLMARAAITRNSRELPGYSCKHICIEPYEAPWLERAVTQVLRQRVEDIDRTLFDELEEGDLLFVDSSHIIRPQGDVVTEYLQILPALRPGVIVHIHDIFSPRDYPAEWVLERFWLWNEQYLLEALLSNTDSWQVIAALNRLKHSHFHELRRACPYLTPDREPGSFYIRKIN